MMLADAVRDCRLMFQGQPSTLRMCNWNAMAAYAGVRVGGDEYFNNLNQPACDYEPGAHAPRDTAVNGRFGLGAPERIVTIVEEPDNTGLSFELIGFDAEGKSVTLATLKRLSADLVPVADREAACAVPAWNSGGDCAAPVTLGASTFQHVDWLRFPPIVLDADGDGSDEIILVSLTPYVGSTFTQIKFEGYGETVVFTPPAAFIGFDIWSEFGAGLGAMERPLSSEAAIQLASNAFVTVQRPTGTCAGIPEVPGAEDIMLLGARALEGHRRIGNALYRFFYDATLQRWAMRRDRFMEDHHKLRHCDQEKVGTVDQAARLHYPSIVLRGPARCDANPCSTESARHDRAREVPVEHDRVRRRRSQRHRSSELQPRSRVRGR